MSAVYFDILKDRLYTFAPDSPARRSGQTAIWRIGEALVRLMAPIMTFTSEEVWLHLPKLATREASVHLALFPAADDVTGGTAGVDTASLTADWDALMAIRSQILKPLEEARKSKVIGAPLEAKVAISAPEPAYSLLRKYGQDLRSLLIVSQVEVERAASGAWDEAGLAAPRAGD